MPVDGTWRIQSSSGTVDPAATSLTPALPNPTTGGSTLLLFVGNNGGSITPQLQSYDPPFFVDQASGGIWYAWRRDNQPAGETSWPITASLTSRWSWWVSEWSGLSTASQPDATSGVAQGTTNAQVNGANGSSGTTPATPDVPDFAALSLWRASGSTSAASIFPAGRSYDAGWSEVACISVGDGTGPTDFQLIIAESYPGVSGTLSSDLTWDITGGGTWTNKSVSGWTACYQPAVPAPALGILAL